MAYDAGFVCVAAGDAAVTNAVDNLCKDDCEIIIVVKNGGVVRFENNIRVPRLEGINGDGI